MRYRVGSRVVTNVDINIVPWDEEDGVAAGDHGEVIDVDPETGDVTVLMDRLIPALVYARNYLFINADHLSRIRPECVGHVSIFKRVVRPAAVSFAATGVFIFILSIGSLSRHVHHRAPEIARQIERYAPTSQAQALVAPDRCYLP